MAVTYSPAYSNVNSESVMADDSCFYSSPPMTIGDRIEERLRVLDMSQAELARRVKVAQPTINALIKGNNQGSKHLHRIASVLQTSPAYLVGDSDDPGEAALSPLSRETLAEQLGLTMIPEVELGYSMGGGSVLEEYRHIGFRAFDQDWLRGLMRGSFEELFVAHGEGDSMEPTLKDGDVVLIDMAQRDIRQQDRIWAISYGDLGMIKRVRRKPGGTYQLLSDNPAVSAIDCADDEMFVVGRVVWIGRRI